jgi:hypothetical protein
MFRCWLVFKHKRIYDGRTNLRVKYLYLMEIDVHLLSTDLMIHTPNWQKIIHETERSQCNGVVGIIIAPIYPVFAQDVC